MENSPSMRESLCAARYTIRSMSSKPETPVRFQNAEVAFFFIEESPFLFACKAALDVNFDKNSLNIVNVGLCKYGHLVNWHAWLWKALDAGWDFSLVSESSKQQLQLKHGRDEISAL